MTNRWAVWAAAAGFCFGTGLLADMVPAKTPDALAYLPPGRMVPGGYWGARVRECLTNRVTAQDVPELIQPFKERKDKSEWRSEFWGKWITSAELACRWEAGSGVREKVEQAVTGLQAAQGPDGYIGAYTPENRLWNWDVWGRKYTMLGLLGWNEISGDASALVSARRLADHLLSETGPGRPDVDLFRHDMWSGMASSSVIEPMTLLYRRTGEARYLDYALWVVKQWERPGGPDLMGKALRGQAVYDMFPGPKPVIKDYMDVGRSKAYEMMSCFEGLLELHRATGRPEFREAAVKVFDRIAEREITVAGSGSDWERWCDGTRRQTQPWQKGMETCVSVTWMKFAAQLERLTGEARYGDAIETAMVNALLGSLGTNGAWFCHHAPLAGCKERAPEQCGTHQNCCVASGPRGLMMLPLLAVLQGGGGPVFNLYGALEASMLLPSGNRVGISETTDYPAGDTVRVALSPERPETFPVRLRIPAWSLETRVEVNGKPEPRPAAGAWLSLSRQWRAGDEVTVRFDMNPRVVAAPGDERYAAVMRGPVVLARDARLGGGVDSAAAVKTSAAGRVALEEVKTGVPAHVWQVWRAPLAGGGSLLLCDFASAGNTWSPESQYRVWLPRRTAP